MNRKSFLAELKSLLSFLDADERAAVIRQYEEMFDAAGASGEEELLRSLGSPVRQVLRIEHDFRSGTLVLHEEESPAEEPAAPAEELPVPVMPEAPAEETSIMILPMPLAVPTEEPAVEEAPAEYIPAEEPPFEADACPEPEETAFTVPIPAGPAPEEPLFTMSQDAGEPVYMSEPVPEEEPTVIPAAPAEEEDVFMLHMSAEPVEEASAEELPAEPPAEEAPEVPAAPPEEAPIETAAPEKASAGAGRVFGAVLVTVPMVALGAVGFAVSLALGALALALGAACGVGAAYCGGYVFGSTITFVPDLLLLGGAMLLCAGLALLFLWLGIWLAVQGIALTVRLIGSVYRSILGKGGKSRD